MKSKNPYSAKSQQGIATVLTVALVGIALIVSITGTAYYLRTKQYSAASNHALTQAQADVWSGVEIVQQYLNTRSASQLDTLMTDGIPAITNLPPNIAITAKIDSVNKSTSESGFYAVTSTITSRNTISKSASTLQVIYEVKFDGRNGASPPIPTQKRALDFYTDVDFKGSVKITGENTENAEISVQGNVTASGVDLEVDTLRATDSVTLSNGKFLINNIYANDNVTVKGNGQHRIIELISTTKNIYFENSEAKTLRAGQDINFINSKLYLEALANNKIKVSDGTDLTRGTNIKSSIDFDCAKTTWSKYKTIYSGNFLSNCETAKDGRSQILIPKGINVIDPNTLGTSSKTPVPIVNALCYDPASNLDCQNNQVYKKGENANYIFEYKDNKIIVTTYNLNGFVNGSTYCAGSGSHNSNNTQHWGYLYPAVINGNSITCGTTPIANIARLYPYWSPQRISYSSWNDTWQLGPDNAISNKMPNKNVSNDDTSVLPALLYPSIAPGTILFKGNLDIQTGVYNNTFLSTKNITYGFNVILYSPNYASSKVSSAVICNTYNTALANQQNLNDISAGRYPMPTNLCKSTTEMKITNMGDIALLAGSFKGNYDKSTYIGGNITTQMDYRIYGNIVAGNLYTSNHTSSIAGFISAMGLTGAKQSNLPTINLIIPPRSNSSDDTNLDNGENNGSGNNAGSSTPSTTIKWARYI